MRPSSVNTNNRGWHIIYPAGSSEKNQEVGWVGRYGVFLGDQSDTAKYILVTEDQTNNRGELHAAQLAGASGGPQTPHLPQLTSGGQWSIGMGATVATAQLV